MPRKIKRDRKYNTLTKIYKHWVNWGYCNYNDQDRYLFYFTKLNKKWIDIVVKLTEDLRNTKALLKRYKDLYLKVLEENTELTRGNEIEI